MTNLRHNGAIIINNSGVRFGNEEGGLKAADIKAQDGGYGYLIFDQAVVDSAAYVQDYKELGYFVEAETLEELAEKQDVPAEALCETCEHFGSFVSNGNDEGFGRTASMFSTLDQAPFYAAKISPANQSTLGGIVTDTSTHVLREDGSAIKGLYSAGETTNYSIYTTSPVVYGRIAAQTILSEAF